MTKNRNLWALLHQHVLQILEICGLIPGNTNTQSGIRVVSASPTELVLRGHFTCRTDTVSAGKRAETCSFIQDLKDNKPFAVRVVCQAANTSGNAKIHLLVAYLPGPSTVMDDLSLPLAGLGWRVADVIPRGLSTPHVLSTCF